MKFHKNSDQDASTTDNDTVKTAKSSSLFPDFGFLQKSRAEEDASTSSAFPEFLFMVPPTLSTNSNKAHKKSKASSKSKKKKKQSCSVEDAEAPRRNSFLTVLEKLLGTDDGKEIISKHANVKPSKKKGKKTHKRSGHPRTVVVQESTSQDQDRRISDIECDLPFPSNTASKKHKTSARMMSASERSATVSTSMDESRSDFFDWKSFSVNSATNTGVAVQKR